MQDNSDEVVTGTRDGVIKARRVCRGSTLSWSERCVGRHGMRSQDDRDCATGTSGDSTRPASDARARSRRPGSRETLGTLRSTAKGAKLLIRQGVECALKRLSD